MKFGQILVWLITNISNMFTIKDTSSYRRHRYELVDEREFVLMNGWMMTSSTLQATSWEPRMNFRKFLSVFL